MEKWIETHKSFTTAIKLRFWLFFLLICSFDGKNIFQIKDISRSSLFSVQN